MGWKPGMGLGKYEQGLTAPILPTISITHNRKEPLLTCTYVPFLYDFELRVLSISKTSSVETTKSSTKILPQITGVINGRPVQILLDSGSEVSCISQNTYNTITNNENIYPLLPLTGVHLTGAMGQRSHRITSQVYVPFTIDNKEYDAVLLIVNKLAKQCILGTDWFQQNKAQLCFNNNQLIIPHVNGEHVIPFDHVSVTVHDVIHDSISTISTLQHEIPNTYESLDTLRNVTLNIDFDPTIQLELYNILKDNYQVFRTKPGLTDKYTHKIILHTTTPFIRKPYPIPLSLRPAVDKVIQDMETDGIIERMASPYASPVTAAKKKDGSVRLCLDARFLNDLMEADTEVPPQINELLQRFHGCKVFTTIDLRASFWQIPLDVDSRRYTAFLYNGKSYVFKVMPFGIKTATASFSRAMDIILGSEVREYAINYVDDLLITSSSIEHHLHHIKAVLEKLKEANITVNINKTEFCKKQVKFLGHIISAEGIAPDPEKVEAIRNFPIPHDVKHLRAFLGLCNYYRKFADSYSKTVLPLQALLKKNVKWNWTPVVQQAFDTTKDLFLKTVILHHPDSSKPYFIQTDSSNFAIGGVLYQENDQGDQLPIAFVSRSLRGPELNYTTTEKELLAILYALSKFRTMILGNNIIFRTDHRALEFLSKCKLHNERIARWTITLNDFNYSIQHIKGKDNFTADVLSRYSPDLHTISSNEQLLVAILDLNTIKTLTTFSTDSQLTKTLRGDMAKLAMLQQQDPYLSPIYKHLKSNEPITDRTITRKLDRFKLHDDVLIYLDGLTPTHTKLAVPESLVESFAWFYHSVLGHFGPSKVYNSIKHLLFWPNMYQRLKDILKTCDICQKAKYSNKNFHGPMNPILVNNPGELVCVDFYGPLPESRGKTAYILVVVDMFSKFTKLYTLRKATAKMAARKIIDDYNKVVKIDTLLSDHGSQFTSRTWAQELNTAGIRFTFSSIRHPQSNPAERIMRELGRPFRTYCHDKNSSWALHLRNIEQLFNTLPHITTGYSPHEIIYGKRPPLPLDYLIQRHLPPPASPATQHELFELVRRNTSAAASSRQKQHKGCDKLNIGDFVLLRVLSYSDKSQKLYAKFHLLYDGPFIVTAQPYPNAYTIKECTSDKIKGTHNIKNLKLYYRACHN